MRLASPTSGSRQHGFTLVELLVALTVMAVLSVLSWRGIDGMLRAQERTRERSDTLLVWQTALAQWRADLDAQLDAAQTLPTLPAPLDWNGQVLRVARRATDASGEGAIVAAWTLRNERGTPVWLRWQSPMLRTRGQLQAAWEQAALWAQSPGDAERRGELIIGPLNEWQIFYFRGGAWSHPLSSDATTGAPGQSRPGAPDGVRLVLSLPSGPALSGRLVLDWARPTLGGGKS